MKNTILFASLTLTLALGLAHAPALRADESDYSPQVYDEDEAKEERSLLRPYLEPAHIPTPEYLASCKGVGGQEYKGDETPEQLKAKSAKFQTIYDSIVAALPEKLSVPVARKRKILVLAYRTWAYYHTPGAAGCLIFLREAAKKYGAFEITEVYKPDGIDAKMLAGFDVVVLDNIMIPGRAGKYGTSGRPQPETASKEDIAKLRAKEIEIWKPLYNELLPAYVKNGGGLVGVHGIAVMPIMGGGDTDKMEFAVMLGGAVDSQCHPLTDGTNKGPYGYCPAPLKILEPNNPLTFAFRDALNGGLKCVELYSFWLPTASMDSSRALIGYDTDKKPNVTFNPKSVERSKEFATSTVWIKSYGKGRVYYSALGHYEENFGVPCIAQAYLDGLLYATGDLKVPDAPATAASANK